MNSAQAPEEKFDLDSLIQVLDFFHRSITVGMVVTITNYTDGSCVYVSPNFKDLTGYVMLSSSKKVA